MDSIVFKGNIRFDTVASVALETDILRDELLWKTGNRVNWEEADTRVGRSFNSTMSDLQYLGKNKLVTLLGIFLLLGEGKVRLKVNAPSYQDSPKELHLFKEQLVKKTDGSSRMQFTAIEETKEIKEIAKKLFWSAKDTPNQLSTKEMGKDLEISQTTAYKIISREEGNRPPGMDVLLKALVYLGCEVSLDYNVKVKKEFQLY